MQKYLPGIIQCRSPNMNPPMPPSDLSTLHTLCPKPLTCSLRPKDGKLYPEEFFSHLREVHQIPTSNIIYKMPTGFSGQEYGDTVKYAYETKVHEGKSEEKEKKRQHQLPLAFKTLKRTHQCPVCDKCFATRYGKRRHQRVHRDRDQGFVVNWPSKTKQRNKTATTKDETSLGQNEKIFESIPPKKSNLETDLDYSEGEEDDHSTSNTMDVQEGNSNYLQNLTAEEFWKTLGNMKREDQELENKNNSGGSVEARSNSEQEVAQSESPPAPLLNPKKETRLLPSLMSLVVNPPMRSPVQLPPSRSVQPIWRPRFPTSGFRPRFYIARDREVCYRCGIPGHYPWNCRN